LENAATPGVLSVIVGEMKSVSLARRNPAVTSPAQTLLLITTDGLVPVELPAFSPSKIAACKNDTDTRFVQALELNSPVIFAEP
jgi:hypothetical protein